MPRSCRDNAMYHVPYHVTFIAIASCVITGGSAYSTTLQYSSYPESVLRIGQYLANRMQYFYEILFGDAWVGAVWDRRSRFSQ